VEAVEQDTTPCIEGIDWDKRRHPRFDIHLPIEYYQFKSSITHIGNISEGGLLIYFPRETHIRQYPTLKLFFSLGSELHAIRLLAKLVWKDNHFSRDREHDAYGLKFVDISSEDGTELRHLLTSLSSPLDDLLYLSNSLEMRFWRTHGDPPLPRRINPPIEYSGY
jgi:hypothetical protein